MISLLLVAAAVSQPSASEPQPYNLGAPATVEGAKLTVGKLLAAMKNKDDAAYDKIARGMVIMLAPDMAMTVDRAKFEQSFAQCGSPQVVSSRPFPKMPQVQAVRITMSCIDHEHSKQFKMTADVMADNEHTFMVFPGSAEHVWPATLKH